MYGVKEPVRIREKRLNDGNINLYLDMYHKGADISVVKEMLGHGSVTSTEVYAN